MPRYHVVLLDADNTLFDFDKAERRALRITLEEHGIPATDVAVDAYLSVNKDLWAAFDRGEISQKELVVERFARTLARLGLTGDADALNRCYLARLGEQSDVLPGAVELCEALAEQCTLALVTNGVASVQYGRLKESPLGKFFPHPFISEELGAQKPQETFFDQVFDALGLTDRADAVMIGDSLSSDILGGNRAGVDTVWFNPNDLPLHGDAAPTYTVSTFDEIRHLILDSHPKEAHPMTNDPKTAHKVAGRRRRLLLTICVTAVMLVALSLGALALWPAPPAAAVPVPVPVVETPTPTPTTTPAPTPTPTPEPTPTPIPPFDFSQSAPETAAAAADYFNDAVFIGDSRTDGFRLYSGIRDSHFLAYKALMVFEITGTHNIDRKKIPVGDTKVTVLDALEQQQYGKVYLMLGVNELGWNKSSEFYDAYCTLIDEVRARQSDAVIYIESIIPVNPEKCAASKSPYYITNDRIYAFNELLRQVAVDKQAVYVDLAAGLTGTSTGVLPPEGATDGIHMTRAYYEKWLAYLQTHTVDKASYDAGQSAASEEVTSDEAAS